jgi:NitT/TauT family transport system substrate-binding protein
MPHNAGRHSSKGIHHAQHRAAGDRLALGALAASASSQTKVAIGYSGGRVRAADARQGSRHFKKNGLDVDMKKIRRRTATSRSRRATCNARRRPSRLDRLERERRRDEADLPDGQELRRDGMAVRNNIAKIADLKGKTVAASAPGTAPYFTLAWFLKKNGLSVKDVTVVNLEPGRAAQAFVAGQNDAAMTYEPYLSTVRDNPQAGKIIATTLDYPMIMDTFGCTPKFLPTIRRPRRRSPTATSRRSTMIRRIRRRATRSWAPT